MSYEYINNIVFLKLHNAFEGVIIHSSSDSISMQRNIIVTSTGLQTCPCMYGFTDRNVHPAYE